MKSAKAIDCCASTTVSLAQDIHGKSLSNVMLAIELPDP